MNTATPTISRLHLAAAGLQLFLSALALALSISDACGSCGGAAPERVAVAALGCVAYASLFVLGRAGRRRAFVAGIFAAALVHVSLAGIMIGSRSICPVCAAAAVVAVSWAAHAGWGQLRRRVLAALTAAGLALLGLNAWATQRDVLGTAFARIDTVQEFSRRSPEAPLELTVYENPSCGHCQEFRRVHAPRLLQEFEGKIHLEYRPAEAAHWVRRTPTIVIEGGAVLEGLGDFGTLSERVRDALARGISRGSPVAFRREPQKWTQAVRDAAIALRRPTAAVAPSSALNVPLVIQEAIYPGVSGIDRTRDPISVGIPLADSAGITSEAQLGLSGADSGQFRVLGRWPSGNVKWVQVDTLADVPAGGQNTGIALTNGAGNFGGSNLAKDNGASIAVDTGSAQFTIRKANFNVIDRAVVNGQTLVAEGTSAGLVVTGPSAGNSSCGTCTTLYSSKNDPASTTVIEENGPVKTVLRATGNHADAGGNVYMHFTVRLSFYKNKSFVKATSVLRNADDGTANTFATAYKGFQAYEVRLAPNLSGTLNYSIGTHAAPQTGTLGGGDSVYLYQGESQLLNQPNWCGFGCVPYTQDKGYSILKNADLLASGSETVASQGWADLEDASGAGIEIGIYQLAAYSPKSLEFNAGGSDLRIGIWARQNSQPYYQAWPAWSIHDLFLNFHGTAPGSPANEFLRFQHYLVGRAERSHYNSAGVFPWPLPAAADEDDYYTSAGAAANPPLDPSRFCCVQDFGLTDLYHWPLQVYRHYPWAQPGGINQEEFRWSNLLNFIKRGFTGRYLDSSHFYRFQAEKSWPHADGTSSTDSTVNGFHWRDKIHASLPGAEVNGLGRPIFSCGGDSPCSGLDNSAQSFVSWFDTYHAHWYGMMDYYFMSGDETIHDALVPMKDYFLNDDTYQAGVGGGLGASRAIGIEMMAATRFSEFLASTGDLDAAGVLAQAVSTYLNFVKPDFCVSGFPAGCTPPPLYGYGSGLGDPPGISRVRGLHEGSANRGTDWCGVPNAGIRALTAYQASILLEGILTLRRSMGPAWSDYETALDLAYGVSQWALLESFGDNGSSIWYNPGDELHNGLRYGIVLDVPQQCPAGTPEISGVTKKIGDAVYDLRTLANSWQAVWMHFYVQHLMKGTTDWERKFLLNMQWLAATQGISAADFGQYQIAAVIDILKNPGTVTLQDLSFDLQDLGNGVYSLRWTVPQGTRSYKIKWSDKIIAPSNGLLNFDPVVTNTFGLDPATHSTWFAATNVADKPIPLAAGQIQTLSLNGLPAGLAAANFSVKAYVDGTGSAGGPPVLDSFTATPSSIAPGGHSTLRWSLSGAGSVRIDQGIGDVTGQTSSSVSPSQTTTYTLTAENAGGFVTASATVFVGASGGASGGTPSSGGSGGKSGGGCGLLGLEVALLLLPGLRGRRAAPSRRRSDPPSRPCGP
jgi:hypothetical protein